MKKIILCLISFFTIFSQNVFAKTFDSCAKASKLNKPLVVMYSADYCFYCKKFKPVFFHLSDNLSDKYTFVYYDVMQKHKPSMCSDVDLDGIPTLYIISKSNKKYLISEKYYTQPQVLKQKLIEYYKNLK